MAITLTVRNRAAANFAALSDRWEAARLERVEFTDDDGNTCHGYRRTDGTLEGKTVVTSGASRAAAQTAAATAAAAAETKYANNMARIQLLATKAAKFAKDPVANSADQLTARQQHELLARLAMQAAADDV